MTGPPPAVAAVRSAVRAALADLPPGSLVLVACSGGPDSLALAAATAFVAPRAGLLAGAVVVDHGLQAGSADVAAAAAAQCRTLGLDPVEVRTAPVGADGGPEAAARTARHAVLDAAARETGAAALLLGHTLDDQAETVLLGLARGAGARSLSGMAARRGLLRRPLLHLDRAAVHASLASRPDLRPWSDPTNADPAVTRSRVRGTVLPVLERQLGPGVAAALARTAAMLREDADALDALAAGLAATAVRPGQPGEDAAGGVEVDVEAVAGVSAAVRHRVLLAAARRAGCPPGDLARGHVLAVDALVTRWSGQGPLDLPGGVRAERACGRLVLRVDAPVPQPRPDRPGPA